MAEHAEAQYGTATGNELAVHEATYQNFVHLTYIALVHVATIAVCLAIGGVQGHWFTMAGLLVLAVITAAIGLATGIRPPAVVVLLLSIVVLALGA